MSIQENNEEFVYGTDEEIFNFSDIEDALEYADCDEPLADTLMVYQGTKRNKGIIEFSSSSHIERFLEDVAESAYEVCGDFAEDWLSHVKSEHINELLEAFDKSLDEWADKHGYQPNFYGVKDIKELTFKVLSRDAEGVPTLEPLRSAKGE